MKSTSKWPNMQSAFNEDGVQDRRAAAFWLLVFLLNLQNAAKTLDTLDDDSFTCRLWLFKVAWFVQNNHRRKTTSFNAAQIWTPNTRGKEEEKKEKTFCQQQHVDVHLKKKKKSDWFLYLLNTNKKQTNQNLISNIIYSAWETTMVQKCVEWFILL